MPDFLQIFRTLARATLHSLARIVIGNVYITDFTVETFPDAGWRVPADSRLFVELSLSISGRTTVRTLGPFTRESEHRWRLSEHLEINADLASVKIVGYIREALGEGRLHMGSTDINENRLLSMRLAGNQIQEWSDTFRDRDGQPTSQITAHVRTWEEDSDVQADDKPGSDIFDTASTEHTFSSTVDKNLLSGLEKRTNMLASDTLEAIEDEQPRAGVKSNERFENMGSPSTPVWSQFQRTESLDAIDDEIKKLHQLLLKTLDSHAEKAIRLNNLGNALRRRFNCTGALSDIEEAIKNLRQAILLTPDGHPEKPGQLNNLGDSLQSRFERTGVRSDLVEAIMHQQEALLSSSDKHPERPAFLYSHGISFLSRFKLTGKLEDIEEAIRNLQKALLLTPEGHPDKLSRLNGLGDSFQCRFQCTRILSDIDEAIKIQQSAVLVTADVHPEKPVRLSSLGNSFQSRFWRTGALSDIEQAIHSQTQAISLTPDGHPEKSARFNKLGHSFQSRFSRTMVFTDIDEAIKNLRQAVLLAPNGHINLPGWFNDLGNSLRSRYCQTGALGDIEDAIQYHQQAVSLTPDECSDKPGFLYSLGISFACHFQQMGGLNNIEEAIKHLQRAVALTEDGHVDKATRLSNLGNSFRGRFQHTGMLTDIEKAIHHQRQAVLLTPDGHPDKPRWLNNLGNSLQSRFKRSGVLGDIEMAVRNQQRAVLLTPHGHPDKSTWLNDLGSSFESRFVRTGVLSDIEEAIRNIEQAVLLTPDGHPDKPSRLNNLGHCVQSRSRHTGELSDVRKAIGHLEQAILLTPHGHPEKPARLGSLGNCYQSLFGRTGALKDIDEAINYQQQAVALTPDGHQNKPELLNNLGNSFQSRFRRTGVLRDIKAAIHNQQQAVLTTPHPHPDEPGRLNNLGNSFRSQFWRTQKTGDLEEAIKNQQRAVSLTPDGHPDKPGWLHSLGISFLARFEYTRTLDDIQKAITNLQWALTLTPDGHSDKPARFNDLGNSFRSRFSYTKARSDIEEAIKNQQRAVYLTPDGHANKPAWLSDLGRCFESRFEHTQVLSDFDAAVAYLRSAATSNAGPPLVRSNASRRWARLVAPRNQASGLDAYHRAIHLIPQIAWIGDPVSVRHFQLNQLDDLSREAAAFALDAGNPDLALEWLEQGRSIVWNQILNLRTFDNALSKAYPDLYAEFIQISQQLDPATFREQGQEQVSDVQIPIEEETQHHHRLAERWDSLVDMIRSLPGFEDFLLSKKVSCLRKAAESGPVVTINVHERRCDALVLLKGRNNVLHIPLTELSQAGIKEMVKSLNRDLSKVHRVGVEHRASKSITPGGPPLPKILSKLFSTVIFPILQGLDITEKQSDSWTLPRIWWCPTGPLTFLPLHAAAGSDLTGKNDEVSNYVVSSYIPTVNALLEARAGIRQSSKEFVGIAMSNYPREFDLKPLWYAPMELGKIGNLFPSKSSWMFKTLHNEQATREQVLEDMASCSWVHLACHAVQDAQEPTQSGLWLHDGRLTIADLTSKRFAYADLAFLSACQTATGDEKSSDEAVHITAAMLGAGYRSVIGTMWSIPDDVAPVLSASIYEKLFSGGKPDSEKAARALHAGVKELRELEEYSEVDVWVPFVHYGL